LCARRRPTAASSQPFSRCIFLIWSEGYLFLSHNWWSKSWRIFRLFSFFFRVSYLLLSFFISV
jgi:hypothetical protein